MKKPPSHLKKQGKKFYRYAVKTFELEDHHIEQVIQAAQCLDRIAEAVAEIESQGSYFKDRFGQPKEHPAHKTERDNKILFNRILRELCLDIEPAGEPGRPPRLY